MTVIFDRADWAKFLREGDEVCAQRGTYGEPEILKVERVTPTQVVISERRNLRIRKSDGSTVGSDFLKPFISPVTDEIRERIYRNQCKREIEHINVQDWSMDKLQRLMAIINDA